MVHRFMIIFHQIKEFFYNVFMLLLVLATYTLHPMAAPWWLVLLRLGLAREDSRISLGVTVFEHLYLRGEER